MQPIDLDQARKLADRSIPEDKISRSWQVCETLFPEQRRAFSVHANSPLTLCSVWATASLFQTSAHTPAKLQLLATFATMVFARSSNWFAGDAKTTMISEGFTEDQAAALLSLTLNVKLSEYIALSLFDRKENNVIALAYHIVWASAQKVIDGGNSERMEKIRSKLRDQMLVTFSPLQVTELTWRVSFCLALMSTNDFLVGDPTPFVVPAAASSIPSNVVSSSSPVLDPQARFRSNSIGQQQQQQQQSPTSSSGSSPSATMGRGIARARSGSLAGRGRRASVSINPYEESSLSSSSSPGQTEMCNVCDTDAKRNALRRVRGHTQCPFCKSVL